MNNLSSSWLDYLTEAETHLKQLMHEPTYIYILDVALFCSMGIIVLVFILGLVYTLLKFGAIWLEQDNDSGLRKAFFKENLPHLAFTLVLFVGFGFSYTEFKQFSAEIKVPPFELREEFLTEFNSSLLEDMIAYLESVEPMTNLDLPELYNEVKFDTINEEVSFRHNGVFYEDVIVIPIFSDTLKSGDIYSLEAWETRSEIQDLLMSHPISDLDLRDNPLNIKDENGERLKTTSVGEVIEAYNKGTRNLIIGTRTSDFIVENLSNNVMGYVESSDIYGGEHNLFKADYVYVVGKKKD